MEALPTDIRNLPTYMVSRQLFICTSVLLIVLLALGLIVTITWIIRSCNHIHNFDYIADFEFQVYRQKKNEELGVQNFEPQEQQFESRSNRTAYNEEVQQKFMGYNRNQSRFLELICLSVAMVININAYSSKTFLLIAYLVALALFLIFNVLRVREQTQSLRLLFYIPLIVTFIPFYMPNKNLQG